MSFRIKSAHIVALCIALVIAGWMLTGDVVIGGAAEGQEQAEAIASSRSESEDKPFQVRFVVLSPETRAERIEVRGRTQAEAIVSIRSETNGILRKRAFRKGQFVERGDVLCEIEKGTRMATLQQAKAALDKAEIEHDANLRLQRDGFASDLKMEEMRLALDSAKANLAVAEWELEKATIRAPLSGIVQDPVAEQGEALSSGSVCATLVDLDPLLFVGQVSERNVAEIPDDAEIDVRLLDGEPVSARLRYLSPSADPETRTFRIEIEIPEPNGIVRDGLSAIASIQLRPVEAFRVSPAWLTLADDGRIGLRGIDRNDRTTFIPVRILAQTKRGFWIAGPEPNQRIITLGQEFVREGNLVEPIPDPQFPSELQSLIPSAETLASEANLSGAGGAGSSKAIRAEGDTATRAEGDTAEGDRTIRAEGDTSTRADSGGAADASVAGARAEAEAS